MGGEIVRKVIFMEKSEASDSVLLRFKKFEAEAKPENFYDENIDLHSKNCPTQQTNPQEQL